MTKARPVARHRTVQSILWCPQESGMARCLTLIPMSAAFIYHLLPKKLKPMERLPLLPPSLSVARERLELAERLDRLEERLRLLERLDDRDDGMPYTHDAENNFGNNRPGADSVTGRVDNMSLRSTEGWRSPHSSRGEPGLSHTRTLSTHHLFKQRYGHVSAQQTRLCKKNVARLYKKNMTATSQWQEGAKRISMY